MFQLKRLLLLFIFILVGATTAVASESEDIATIRQRYIDGMLASTPSDTQIKSLLDRFDAPSGSWSDVDYKSMIASGWRTLEHADRAAQLAKFYYSKKESELFTREQLFEALSAAMEYWYREKPYCKTNWYHNEISCPSQMGTALMLMQQDMTQEQVNKATEIIFAYVEVGMTGSNLLFLANNTIMKGILVNDSQIIKDAVEAVSGTIFVAEAGEEGIQRDFSYHLHGSQQQFGNYGLGCLRLLSNFCELFAETSFSFSKDKQDVIANYLTQGYRWILYKGYFDINGSGRQYIENSLKHRNNSVLGAAQKISKACTPEQQAQIATIVKENQPGAPVVFQGQKYFYCSDGLNHHRADWAASLKMHSVRVQGTECVNEDNLKGFYSADGAFYIYVDGDEYENAPVLWDWRKVPGITCYDEQGKIKRPNPKQDSELRRAVLRNNTDFVGACTDGTRGMAAMIVNRDSLWAKKAWVITEDFALCLGTDIKDSIQTNPLTTSIEQKIIKGYLLRLEGNQWVGIKDKFVTDKQGVRLYNHKTGYIVLDGEQTEASIETRTEDWFNISNGREHKVYTDDVLTIFVRHNTQGATYQYLILPAKTKEQVASLDIDAVKVLSNTPELQLVEIDGQYYATAYQATKFKNKDVSVKFSHAGIFMFKKQGADYTIIAHDPTQKISNEKMAKFVRIK